MSTKTRDPIASHTPTVQDSSATRRGTRVDIGRATVKTDGLVICRSNYVCTVVGRQNERGGNCPDGSCRERNAGKNVPVRPRICNEAQTVR